MILSKENIDFYYNRYLSQFEKSNKYVRRMGGKTRGLKPLTRKEFGVDFVSEVYDNPKWSGTRIAEKMAKAEVYPRTWRQAQVAAEAHAQHFGVKNTFTLQLKYMTEAEDALFSSINEFKKELMRENKNISKKEIRQEISSNFFYWGSQ